MNRCARSPRRWVFTSVVVLLLLPKLILVVAVVLATFMLLGTLLGLITHSDREFALDWLHLRVQRD